MGWIDGIVRASGLDATARTELEALMGVYRATRRRNSVIELYYEGKVGPRPISNDTMMGQVELDVELSCDWPRKAVHELANLVRFDGFVFDGERDEGLYEILRDCGFDAAFSRHRVGMLKKGCMFATVGTDGERPWVRFHSADSGAAIMNTATERMRSGFVIANVGLTDWSPKQPVPTQVNLHMPGRQVAIHRVSASEWAAEDVECPEGVCMMVPIAYAPTDSKPLGSTRITRAVRDLVDDVLHIRQVLALSMELYAIPMRYIVGLNSESFNALKENPKWSLYLNPVFTATRDKKGDTAELGQLPANSPAALLELLYADAQQFSSATGVPTASLGLVQDSAVSADGIQERKRTLTDEAQSLIDGQLKPALREIALLLMMVSNNVASVDGLTDEQRSVMPRFRSPAMPSISAATDAAMKIASVNPAFAQTRSFFEMIGFDEAATTRAVGEMRMNQMRANMPPMLSQTRGEANATLGIEQRTPLTSDAEEREQ